MTILVLLIKLKKLRNNLTFENNINKIRKLFISKKYNEVLKLCEKLIKEYSEEAILYNFAGVSCQALKKFEKSIIFLKKATKIDPKNISYLNNLANSYTTLRNYADAEKAFINALSINNDNIVILNNFASFQKRVSNYAKAIKLYEKLILLEDKPYILQELADCYQIIGDFEKSKKLLNKNINAHPKFIKSHYTKSFSTNYSSDNEHLNKMIELNETVEMSIEDKIFINYALGKAYEDKKDYANAFKYFDEANKNQSKISNFSIENTKKLFEKIKIFFKQKKNIKIKKEFNSTKMVFICGLPRSGTTLVNQILSSHSEIQTVGEISLIRKLIEEFFYDNDSISYDKINDEIKLDTNKLNNFFFNDVNFFLQKSKSKYVIDKTPTNFIWIGFLKIFFPNSIIIYCKRNYKDNFLSLFKNNLLQNQNSGWACNPEYLLDYIKMTDDLISFWKSFNEKIFYEINYENLIKDSKYEIKNLLNHCELSWDENCFDFYKNRKSNITTLSVHQARQPIYSSSLNSHMNYSKYLNKYFDKL